MLHSIGGPPCHFQSAVNARYWLTNYRAAHDLSPADSFLLCHLSHNFQRAHKGAFGQFDFEGIVMERFGVSERGLSRSTKILLIGIAAFEYLLSFQGAPRLGANAAQRHAHALHALALHLGHNGGGRQREFIRGAVTTLEVVRTRSAPQPWQTHRGEA